MVSPIPDLALCSLPSGERVPSGKKNDRAVFLQAIENRAQAGRAATFAIHRNSIHPSQKSAYDWKPEERLTGEIIDFACRG